MKITHEQSLAPVITDMEELAQKVAALKTLGQTIVVTQGVWDMFHPGHARYLAKAKQEGDVLIVGVDSDEMARTRKRDKWPPRPFDPFDERVELVRSLRCVDFVVPHADLLNMDDTLIAIRPDVLVVSMSTGPEVQNQIERLAQFAGCIRNYEPQSSNSTTAKNRKLAGEVFAEFCTTTKGVIEEVGEGESISQLKLKLQEAFTQLEEKIKS